MKTIIVNSGNAALSVTIYNPHNEETIMLLHGGPGLPDYLEDIAIFLCQNFRVITFDQRGAGQSKLNGHAFSIDDYVDDINTIAEALDIRTFHVFGHSWGGLLAQLYACRNQEKLISIFLCNPFPGVGQKWIMMEKDIIQFIKLSSSTVQWFKILYNYLATRKGLEKADKAMRRMLVLLWSSYAKRYGLSGQNGEFKLRGINAKALFKTRANLIKTPDSSLEKLESIKSIPTLILFGAKDIFLQTKWITRTRYPLAQYIELDGAGHFPWLEEEDNFKQLLLQFYDMKQ